MQKHALTCHGRSRNLRLAAYEDNIHKAPHTLEREAEAEPWAEPSCLSAVMMRDFTMSRFRSVPPFFRLCLVSTSHQHAFVS